MVKVKLMLYRNKPRAAFLSEQTNDVILLFPGHNIYHEEFDIKPAFAMQNCILKAIVIRDKITLLIDSDENLKQHVIEQIPFLLIGDGDLLLKVGNAMDGRQVKEIDPFKKKKRGIGGMYGDDDEDDNILNKSFFDDDKGGKTMFGDDEDLPIKPSP